MCIACLEYVKGTMTVEEVKHAVDEMDRIREEALYGSTGSSLDWDDQEAPEHIQAVLDEIDANAEAN